MAELKPRLQDSLSILGDIQDGQPLAKRLEDNPEAFFFFTGVMNGLIERASRRVQANDLSQTSLDSAIQAEISELVDDTDSKKYAGFLRAYAIFLIEANESTANGLMAQNFRSSDPNETIRIVSAMDDIVNQKLEGEELVRQKGLQFWLNTALANAVPVKEQETARGPSGPGFAGTLDTQRTNPIYGIRTLFQGYSPNVLTQFTGEIPEEKKSREHGIPVIIAAYENAGIKLKGNNPYEKYEDLLINLSTMVGRGMFKVGRAPDGGPESAHITNVMEYGGILEDAYTAEGGTGYQGSLTRRQNLGAGDPTTAVFAMQAALGTNFESFLELVVPGLAKQGKINLSDLALVWEDYNNLNTSKNSFKIVDQETVVDFDGVNERITGQISVTQIPGQFSWLAQAAYVHPPIDLGTRDVQEIERLASFGISPYTIFGINDQFRPPTTANRLESVTFGYLFAPRTMNQRTQAAYEKDITAVLEHFNNVPGRFRTDLTNDEIKTTISNLAKQLEEQNKSYGRRLDSRDENVGTLTNAYMFSEIKRVFFGDYPSDPNETFLPIRIFEDGNALLAGNREAMFKLEFPSTAAQKARTSINDYTLQPIIRQYTATEGAITKTSSTISLGIPLLPSLMPYSQPVIRDGIVIGLTGTSSDELAEFDYNMEVMGKLYTEGSTKTGYNFGAPGSPGAPSITPTTRQTTYNEEERLKFQRNPWVYIRGIKVNPNIPIVPSYKTPTFPPTTNLPPTNLTGNKD